MVCEIGSALSEMDLERSARPAINSEWTVVNWVDKVSTAFVRRSKKAVSEARGIIYSRAELLGMCVESRATGRVLGTHESVGIPSKDAKMGT